MSDWLDEIKAQENELLDKAKEDTKRKQDNEAFHEPSLLDSIAAKVREKWNTEAEIWRKAKRILDRAAKPGSTKPNGQLTFPNFDPYPYEPERMVRNNNDEIVENSKARPDFKIADAARARENATRATLWADRKQREAQEFYGDALEAVANGEKLEAQTWGKCVIKKKLWEP